MAKHIDPLLVNGMGTRVRAPAEPFGSAIKAQAGRHYTTAQV
jgi:hypothetical protein